MTRAEFTLMLAAALGLEPVLGASLEFADELPVWAAGYVAAAVEAGLVQGFPDGTFRPAEPITREQLAAMAVRAVGGSGFGSGSGSGSGSGPGSGSGSGSSPGSGSGFGPGALSFADTGQIAGWAGPSVGTAVALALVTGFEDNTFRPHQIATRAQRGHCGALGGPGATGGIGTMPVVTGGVKLSY